MILGSKDILRLIRENEMITGYVDLKKQLQPNGFDLTVDRVFKPKGLCVLSELHKVLPNTDVNEIDPETMRKDNFVGWVLEKGTYLIEINETIKLPKDIFALSNQRSSLMRMMCRTNIGSWDSGYCGKGYSILTVFNPDGLLLEKDVRVIQIHFFKSTGVLSVYNGNYQNENLGENL